jgi:hypothetical protein
MYIFNIHTNMQQNKRLFTHKTVGGVSRTNNVPYMEYVPSFLENDEVQQPVILPNINENKNPWHMHIFNIHTNMQQYKRLLTQKLGSS